MVPNIRNYSQNDDFHTDYDRKCVQNNPLGTHDDRNSDQDDDKGDFNTHYDRICVQDDNLDHIIKDFDTFYDRNCHHHDDKVHLNYDLSTMISKSCNMISKSHNVI